MADDSDRATEARCCGQKYDWLAAGRPLVNACQLCPKSPTYWRNTSEPATTTTDVAADPGGSRG